MLIGAIPAAAATSASWATWQPLAGTAGAFTSSVQVAAQPEITATVTSDSRGGQVGVISGASTWLSEDTPIGAKYGSSRDKPYLNLRPKADNATGPSTTTYSFAAPTPRSGWAFALGDIDADSVRIVAVAPDGHVLDASEIGFNGGFNYCAPDVAAKPSCTGAAEDMPTWDAANLTLTGNAAATDTNGSAAWFEPSTPISSLSFVFTRRSGFPVYQTWFASIAQNLTGAVTDVVDGALGGVGLILTDANGTVVGATRTAADGTYSFPGYVAADGYTVQVIPPAGKIPTSTGIVPVDLSGGDAVANFEVRDIVPVAVSGRVIDTTGAAVPGVNVTLDGQTATTDADGRYLFDQVPVGTHTATITPPPGYSIDLAPPAFTVPPGSEDPIDNVDFRVAEKPDLSGTVRSNGTGVAGVIVTAVGPGGITLRKVTDGAGTYLFPRLDAGTYAITIVPPEGLAATSPITRDEQISGADITAVDFELARFGALAGTVRGENGAPISGVGVTVSGPAALQQLTTATDGTFGMESVPPGIYTLTVVPPVGATVVGPATKRVVITAAGEEFTEQDFTLTVVEVVPPAPGMGTLPSSGAAPDVPLPATGLGPETWAWAVGGVVVLVLGVTLFLAAARNKPSS